jgi:hypothetical protein
MECIDKFDFEEWAIRLFQEDNNIHFRNYLSITGPGEVRIGIQDVFPRLTEILCWEKDRREWRYPLGPTWLALCSIDQGASEFAPEGHKYHRLRLGDSHSAEITHISPWPTTTRTWMHVQWDIPGDVARFLHDMFTGTERSDAEKHRSIVIRVNREVIAMDPDPVLVARTAEGSGLSGHVDIMLVPDTQMPPTNEWVPLVSLYDTVSSENLTREEIRRVYVEPRCSTA